MNPSKYFIFAYDFHEQLGGINDLVATCETFEQAEESLFSIKGGPYGFFEGAHIATIDDSGQLIKIAEYSNLGNKCWSRDAIE